MYEAFYGLREKPFNLTPDPKYLYLSDKHKEAFAHLLFGIKNRSGFVMVTGEIGTGKTTICRNLLNQLDDNTELAFIFNPPQDPMDLLKKINAEFGIDTASSNILDLTERLNEYLLDAAGKDRNCVLIIDEAQGLTPDVLERIRLLSNLETETEKLLQIILIGQPELLERLALHELRQLNQRITARYHLKALSERETLQYIAYRLHVAGGRRKVHFSKAAIRAIYRASKGTPRVINALCDRALLIGYTKEAHSITGAIVKRAAHEIRGEAARKERRWPSILAKWAPSPSLIVTAVLVIVLVQFFALPLERAARELGLFNTYLGADRAAPDPRPPADGNTADATVAPGSALRGQLDNVLVESEVARSVVRRIMTPEFIPEPIAEPTFMERLGEVAADTARETAASELFQAWNVAAAGTLPADDEVESITRFAAENGFAAEVLRPALAQLIAVDLPAFFLTEAAGEQRWLALLAAENDAIRVSAAPGKALTVSRDELRTCYAGQAVVLWRDPQPNAKALLPGASSRSVTRLKEQLRSLKRLSAANTSSQYDTPTAGAVAKLQAETGLLVDGMAGRQVRMVLTAWLAEDDTPRLSGGMPSEAQIPQTPQERALPSAEALAAILPEIEAEPDPEPPVPEVVTGPPVEVLPAEESPAEDPFTKVLPVDTPPAEESPAAVSPIEEPTLEEPPAERSEDDPSEAELAPRHESEALIEVTELPDPPLLSEGEAGADPLKASTPPAVSSVPLVPHEPANQ